MSWFRRRAKVTEAEHSTQERHNIRPLEDFVPSETAHQKYFAEYAARPVVAPEAVYPLINRGVTIALTFSSLSSRLFTDGAFNLGMSAKFMKQWEETFPRFQAAQKEFQEAVQALASVRISDSEKNMKAVHIGADVWATDMYVYYLYDAEAFQAMMHSSREEYLRRQERADLALKMAQRNKALFARALRLLRAQRPEQFAALGVSENDLIDLGLSDLI